MSLEVVKQTVTNSTLLMQRYQMYDGFAFTAIRYPANVFDAIIIRNPSSARSFGDAMPVSARTLDEHIRFINQYKIDKAIVVAEDISFLNKCPCIKHVNILPSVTCGNNFDFSPLYSHPIIQSVYCMTEYGKFHENNSIMDYTKIRGLEDLRISSENEANFQRISSLKKLSISHCISDNLSAMFCSKELDTLEVSSCKIRCLDGVEAAPRLQCLYLTLNRQLEDISSLETVKKTIRALRIVKCPKVKDFSVLSKLENLEYLFLESVNKIPNLNFLDSLPNLKTFICNMEVEDGNLIPCLRLSYAHCGKMRKHYNLKTDDLPKGIYYHGNENIELWRRVQ